VPFTGRGVWGGWWQLSSQRESLIVTGVESEMAGCFGILMTLQDSITHKGEERVELLRRLIHIDHKLFHTAQFGDTGRDIGIETGVDRVALDINFDN